MLSSLSKSARGNVMFCVVGLKGIRSVLGLMYLQNYSWQVYVDCCNGVYVT